MSDNRAAFRVAEDRRFIVREADDQFADDEEIIVKNVAISINPVDAFTLYPKFPQIPGVDVAGEVVDVGIDVENFQEGDRVLGHALAVGTNENRHGGFQKYTAIPSNMAARIPREITYEQAASLPLGVSTAAAALFQKDFFGLDDPKVNATTSPNSKAVVIIGAAGNVGSNAVQLARAAGHTVIGTAAPAKSDMVKKLGAHEVVSDRGDRNVVIENIKKALNGKECVGAFDAAGFPDSTDANNNSKNDGTHRLAMDIAGAVAGDHIAVSVQSYDDITKEGVVLKDVMAVAIRNNEVGKKVYTFLQKALQLRQYQILDTTVVGNKLEDVWDAVMSKQTNGKKIVLLE